MSTENVSWSKPFGDSAASKIGESALGTGAGTPWSAGNTNRPEDYLKAAANPYYSLGGYAHDTFVRPYIKGWTGYDVPVDPIGSAMDQNGIPRIDTSGQQRINQTQDAAAARVAAGTPGPPQSPRAPLTSIRPSNNTSQEDMLRKSYLDALNQNYGFNFTNTSKNAGSRFSANNNVRS